MGKIHTPRTVLRKGRETWATKKDKKETQPTKLERTSATTFNVTHEDGSIFECKMDPSKVRFKKDSMKDAGGSTKVFSMGSPCSTCGSKWHSECAKT